MCLVGVQFHWSRSFFSVQLRWKFVQSHLLLSDSMSIYCFFFWKYSFAEHKVKLQLLLTPKKNANSFFYARIVFFFSFLLQLQTNSRSTRTLYRLSYSWDLVCLSFTLSRPIINCLISVRVTFLNVSSEMHCLNTLGPLLSALYHFKHIHARARVFANLPIWHVYFALLLSCDNQKKNNVSKSVFVVEKSSCFFFL